MVKDLFGRHTPIRHSGFELRKRATDDANFVLKYKRPECAELFVTLDFGRSYFTLYGFTLSFCLTCGRFLGFGIRYELCWICESELEHLKDDEEG